MIVFSFVFQNCKFSTKDQTGNLFKLEIAFTTKLGQYMFENVYQNIRVLEFDIPGPRGGINKHFALSKKKFARIPGKCDYNADLG